jgi:hypothetical protein
MSGYGVDSGQSVVAQRGTGEFGLRHFSVVLSILRPRGSRCTLARA